jgi:hypothetical protein
MLIKARVATEKDLNPHVRRRACVAHPCLSPNKPEFRHASDRDILWMPGSGYRVDAPASGNCGRNEEMMTGVVTT